VADRCPTRVVGPRPEGTAARTLAALELVVGVFGVAGGAFLVARPGGSLLGMTTADLLRCPFSDYSIPGLLLLVVVNGGCAVAGIAAALHHRQARPLGLLSGATLIGFEIVEVGMIRFSPLQPAIAVAGAAVVVLAWLLRTADLDG
jgi:hypothetical protein